MTLPPEPPANPDLFGHAATEAMLAGLLGGRLHHAWLLTGPAGIGKATLAYRFARRLLAASDPAVAALPGLSLPSGHPVFRRVAAGTHADLHTIARAIDPKTKRLRGEIVVDDVRAAAGLLRRTPGEGGWRVLVVDRVDEMNRNAANALLKLLEEPPPRAVLLLVCDAPGRVLPTLRSRCRRLTLAALGQEAMDAALRAWLPEETAQARDRLAALADGAPGRALMLADQEGLRLSGLVDRTLQAVLAAPSSGDAAYASVAYGVAEALGREDHAFGIYVDLLRGHLAAAVRDGLRGRADPAQQRLAALHPAATWAGAWQRLGVLQYETEQFNLDHTQAILSLFSILRDFL
jgi:DNA polymerase-3 subunit delta'